MHGNLETACATGKGTSGRFNEERKTHMTYFYLAYVLTVKGARALTEPHSILSVAPAGVSSIEIVSCSTGAAVLAAVIGVRPRSWPAGYGNPPRLRALADDELP